ncbi:hypothetical protein H0X06_02610 [Candidatus Dependentiae bacterium]|nr:hypothetical protein [Candidatus Dependentiae bacterium]
MKKQALLLILMSSCMELCSMQLALRHNLEENVTLDDLLGVSQEKQKDSVKNTSVPDPVISGSLGDFVQKMKEQAATEVDSVLKNSNLPQNDPFDIAGMFSQKVEPQTGDKNKSKAPEEEVNPFTPKAPSKGIFAGMIDQARPYIGVLPPNIQSSVISFIGKEDGGLRKGDQKDFESLSLDAYQGTTGIKVEAILCNDEISAEEFLVEVSKPGNSFETHVLTTDKQIHSLGFVSAYTAIDKALILKAADLQLNTLEKVSLKNGTCVIIRGTGPRTLIVEDYVSCNKEIITMMNDKNLTLLEVASLGYINGNKGAWKAIVYLLEQESQFSQPFIDYLDEDSNDVEKMQKKEQISYLIQVGRNVGPLEFPEYPEDPSIIPLKTDNDSFFNPRKILFFAGALSIAALVYKKHTAAQDKKKQETAPVKKVQSKVQAKQQIL